MAQAYKKYIVIDHTNNRWTFVRSVSEVTTWLNSYSITISTLPVTSTGALSTIKLIDVTTGLDVPIKPVISNASICIQ
jgi:hypothetical protein